MGDPLGRAANRKLVGPARTAPFIGAESRTGLLSMGAWQDREVPGTLSGPDFHLSFDRISQCYLPSGLSSYWP